MQILLNYDACKIATYIRGVGLLRTGNKWRYRTMYSDTVGLQHNTRFVAVNEHNSFCVVGASRNRIHLDFPYVDSGMLVQPQRHQSQCVVVYVRQGRATHWERRAKNAILSEDILRWKGRSLDSTQLAIWPLKRKCFSLENSARNIFFSPVSNVSIRFLQRFCPYCNISESCNFRSRRTSRSPKIVAVD